MSKKSLGSTIVGYGAELRDIRERLDAGELSVAAARVLVAAVKVQAKLLSLEIEHATATGRLLVDDAVPTFRRDGKRPRA